MGWQDDEVVEPAQASWQDDPVVEQQPTAQAAAPQQPGLLDRTAQLASTSSPFLTPLVEMAAHAGSGMLATPVAGLAGIAGSLLPGQRGQGADVTEAVQSAGTYQPRTPMGQGLQKAGGMLPGLIAKGGDAAGQFAADVTGSPAVGAAVNTAVQFAPALLLRGRAGKVVENVNRRITDTPGAARPAAASETAPAAQRPAGLASVSKDAPSIDQLKLDAKAAYKRAEDAGIKISAKSFEGLKAKIVNELGERTDPTLHPDTTAALKRITTTKGEISLEKLDGLRQIANDAKGSVKPADQRLAAKIVDSIDEYVDGISAKDVTRGDPKGAAALKEARDLYSRQKKAETIDNLIQRAEISAPNFSASGMENALRTEFRALAKNQKQMKRFTPEERAAIIRVAKGGKAENALRMLGKFAPTGALSTAISGTLGFMAGGPAGAGALPAAGALSRYAATRMTIKNANAASELMRRGPQKNALKEPEKQRNALLNN
jgi:hypothetical protein